MLRVYVDAQGSQLFIKENMPESAGFIIMNSPSCHSHMVDNYCIQFHPTPLHSPLLYFVPLSGGLTVKYTVCVIKNRRDGPLLCCTVYISKSNVLPKVLQTAPWLGTISLV